MVLQRRLENSPHLPSSGRGQHLQSKPKDSNAGAGYIKAGELERLAEKVGALQVETGGVDGPAALDGRAATDVDNICVGCIEANLEEEGEEVLWEEVLGEEASGEEQVTNWHGAAAVMGIKARDDHDSQAPER